MIYYTRNDILVDVIRRGKIFFSAIDEHAVDPACRVFLDSTEKLSDGLTYNPVYRFLWERGELTIHDNILSWMPFSGNGNRTYQINLIDLKCFMAAYYGTVIIYTLKEMDKNGELSQDPGDDWIGWIDRQFTLYIRYLWELHCDQCYDNGDNPSWESFDGNPLYNILTTEGDFTYKFDDCAFDGSDKPSKLVFIQLGPHIEYIDNEVVFSESLFKYLLVHAFNYSSFISTIALIRREYKEAR